MKVIHKNTLHLGKIDYNGRGRKVNACEIEYELRETDKGLEFSASGGIRNGNHSDYQACGQMIDEIADHFKGNAKVQRLREVWKLRHLNGMRAGTPVQTQGLKEFYATRSYPNNQYENACAYLADKGLLIDNGYKYGSAWLHEPLPDEVVALILRDFATEPATA